jgi:2-methylcitrate dehydratase PrpD
MSDRLRQLARFVAETPAAAIPAAAVTRAKQALVDFAGVAIAGADEPVSRLVRGFAARSGGVGKATLIGSGHKAGPLDAALANATTGHALDYDDSNFALGGHPSVTLLPAVLALGEHAGCSGRQVLEAYIMGFEVLIRMARIVNFHHYEKGWHPTATIGTFGVAAAAARLLGLDAARTMSALGLAASMASGIKENFGTMAKPIQVGHAAQKGLMAALFAAEGATASPEALEGRQGFLAVYNGAGNYSDAPLEGLGQTWELLGSGLMFKKYACCGSTHPVIDAAVDLAVRDDLDADTVGKIHVAINPRRIPHVDRPRVTDSLEAKFSLQYTAAAALKDRGVGLRHFTDAQVNRADLQALAARVEVSGLGHVDSDLSQACELKVTLRDGSTRSIWLAEAHGRKADDYELFKRTKFLDCAAEMLRPEEAVMLLGRLEAFEDERDIAAVLGAMTPAGAPRSAQQRFGS